MDCINLMSAKFGEIRRMKTRLFGINPACVAVGAAALMGCADPALARVTIPVYDESALKVACDAALSRGRSDLQRLEAIPLAKVSAANTLNAWNAMQMRIEDVLGPGTRPAITAICGRRCSPSTCSRHSVKTS